jgi:hypothetical protein
MGLTQEIHEGPIRVKQPAHIVHSAPRNAGKMSGDTIAVAYGGGMTVERDGSHVEGQLPASPVENLAAARAQRDLALVLSSGSLCIHVMVETLHLYEACCHRQPQSSATEQHPP